MGAEEKLRRLAEAVAEEMKKQTDETEKKFEEIQVEMQQLRKQSNKGGDEAKKDTKRSEPKDAFNGKNLIDFEWRINNHIETCFGDEGRRMMQWIREKA